MQPFYCDFWRIRNIFMVNMGIGIYACFGGFQLLHYLFRCCASKPHLAVSARDGEAAFAKQMPEGMRREVQRRDQPEEKGFPV